MQPAAPVLRALDPAERYFWLLGHVANMNLVMLAELECRVEPADLRRALDALQRRHPLLRAGVEVRDGEPVFVEAAAEIALGDPTAPGDGASFRSLVERPFAASGPLARCVYAPAAGEDRSTVALVVHHALVDARAGVRALQHMLGWIDAGDGGPGVRGSVPPPLHERFPAALRSPRAAVGVLSTIRAERDGQAEPAAFACHAGAAARTSRYARLVLPPAAVRRLVEAARAEGTSVTGAIAAAVLQSAAALDGAGEDRTICLAVPTDLRSRVEPPIAADDVVVAIGLLCTPYRVCAETEPTLARDIGEQVAREVARGESHLFYRFARAGSFAVSGGGIESFGTWLAASAQNVAVSNVGVVDDTGDPTWVRRVTFALSPAANQVAFVSVTTYRGELLLTVATDEAKLPLRAAEQLVAGIGARLGAARMRTDLDEHQAAG